MKLFHTANEENQSILNTKLTACSYELCKNRETYLTGVHIQNKSIIKTNFEKWVRELSTPVRDRSLLMAGVGAEEKMF